jgi:hypothetical protein
MLGEPLAHLQSEISCDRFDNRTCLSSGSYPIWVCDCLQAAHVSDGLLTLDFGSKSFASVCAELMRVGGQSCNHIAIAPSVLARCQERDYVTTDHIPDCYVLHASPFAASVLDGSGPHRVVVFQSDRGMLRCSKCSGRTYLCEHCKAAALESPPEWIELLNVEINGQEVKRVKQLANPPTLADLKAYIPPRDVGRIPWPPKLPSELVTRCVPPPSCSCGHSLSCITNCRCERRLELLPSVRTAHGTFFMLCFVGR